LTKPSVISFSAERRLAIPQLARYLLILMISSLT
jgi:hypothetical protein